MNGGRLDVLTLTSNYDFKHRLTGKFVLDLMMSREILPNIKRLKV